ncbi:MAG TPA: MFS transporter [Nitrososphaeraceae archaeon]|nr:MFS transporter [Nitrososphaeraceae archaeon]
MFNKKSNHHSIWTTLAILSSIATISMYTETMLLPALPQLIDEFDLSYNTSSWILSAYLVAGAVITPVSGKLSDIYGKKKIMIILISIYTIGLIISPLSSNFFMLLISRILQGIGISVFPVTFGLVREHFPREKLAISQGIISSMFAGGSVLGLAIGGTIVQYYNWRFTFFSIIPIAICLIFIIMRFIPMEKKVIDNSKIENHKSNERFDLRGSILLGVSIITFLLFITFLKTDSLDANFTILNFIKIPFTSLICLIFFISSFIAFLSFERKTKFPLISSRLFFDRRILASNIILLIVGMSMFTIFQTLPILVQSPYPVGFNNNPLQMSLVQIPFAIVLLILGPLAGFMISRIGQTTPLVIGTVAMSLGFSLILLGRFNEFYISLYLVIISIGLSLTNVSSTNIVMVQSSFDQIGISLGISNLLRIIGSSIGPTIAGLFMQTHLLPIDLSKNQNQYFPTAAAYDLIFGTMLILSLFALSISFFLTKNQKSGRWGIRTF